MTRAPTLPPWTRLYVVAAAVQLIAVLASHLVGYTTPAHPDAIGQDLLGVRIAEAWRDGGFPSSEVLRSITGTQLWAPELLIGAVYRFAGDSWFTVRVVMALVAAVGPVAIAAIASRFTTRRAVVLAAFAVAAIWPATIYWTVLGVKDGYVSGLGLGALALLVNARTPWSVITVGGAASAALLLFRPVLALAAAAAALVAFFVRRPVPGTGVSPRLLVPGMAVVVIGLTFALPRAVELGRTLDTNTIEIAGEGRVSIVEDGVVSNVARAARPTTVGKALTSPLPWKLRPSDASPHRWLFPSTAVWIAALPAIGLGLWWSWRSHRGYTAIAGAFLASYFGLYLLTFAGEFTRQRSLIEPLGLMFAVLAATTRPQTVLSLTVPWVGMMSAFGLLHFLLLAGRA